MNSTTAILLVDPQLDFMPGGALPVPDGDKIVGPCAALMNRHHKMPIYASADWHPQACRHFQSWPVYCLQNSSGAEFHEGLGLSRRKNFVCRLVKGTAADDDNSYSAFTAVTDNGQATPLYEELCVRKIDTLIVAGLCQEICVQHTVMDALSLGFKVQLYLPGIRALNLNPGDGERALAEMLARGATIYETPAD